MERYEEASSNQYSEDVQVLLRVKEQGDGKSLAYNTHPASFKPPVEVKTWSRHTHTVSHTKNPFGVLLQKHVGHPGSVLMYGCLSVPESSSEEQEDPQGSARLGPRLPHH